MDTQLGPQVKAGMGPREFALSDDYTREERLKQFRTMLKDPTIKGALRIKQFLLLSYGWEVEGEGREADFVRDSLAQMQGTVEQMLLALTRAGFAYGTACAEIVWERYASGPWSGYLYPQSLRVLPTAKLKFQRDDFGQLTGIVAGGKPWPLEKFLLYLHNPDEESPLGVADLEACEQAWLMKVNSWKDFGEALWRSSGVNAGIIESESAPSGSTAWADGQPDMSTENRTIAAEIAKVFRGNQIINVPPGTQIIPFDFKLAPEGFEIAQKRSAKEIMQAILGVTLLMDEGADSGSYGLGKVHWDVLRGQIVTLQRVLAEDVLTEQLVRRLVLLNFGDADPMPQFRLNPMPEQDAAEVLQALRDVVMAGLIDPRIAAPKAAELLGLPTGPDDEGAVQASETANKIGGAA